MATWQLVILAFVVLVPLALMADFYPHRERLSARGRPLERDWAPQLRHPEPDDDTH